MKNDKKLFALREEDKEKRNIKEIRNKILKTRPEKLKSTLMSVEVSSRILPKIRPKKPDK